MLSGLCWFGLGRFYWRILRKLSGGVVACDFVVCSRFGVLVFWFAWSVFSWVWMVTRRVVFRFLGVC